MQRMTASTFWVKIYMAGDIDVAKQVCREVCFRDGWCVTVKPCDYIYTGGEEAGFEVGIINYARFPSVPHKIQEKAEGLATALMERCCQHSYTIETPFDTIWVSRREEKEKTTS